MIRLWRASVVDVLAIAAASLIDIGRGLVEMLLRHDEPNDLGGGDT